VCFLVVPDGTNRIAQQERGGGIATARGNRPRDRGGPGSRAGQVRAGGAYTDGSEATESNRSHCRRTGPQSHPSTATRILNAFPSPKSWRLDEVRALRRWLRERRVKKYGQDFGNQLDAVTAAAKVGLTPERVFKTLVVRGDKAGVVMACIPALADLDLKALAAHSGNKRTEMVPVKDLPALTGYQRGGVSPLGGKGHITVFVDDSARALDQVSISAGRRGLQIVLSEPDLVRAAGAAVVPLTRPRS
jgi:Cys-tRNA(Pro)/Cys-tRNA(Cys) deacylase